MKQRLLVLVFMLLLFAGIPAAFAQNRTVSGKVSDANGTGMMGVNILVKGTSVGTVSNADGLFSINVPETAKSLVFSYIGFASQEVDLSGRTNVNVTLQEDVSEMEKVV